MTTKEKAKELVNKYHLLDAGMTYDEINWINAKQCALIAVDELIMEIYNIDHQYRAIYNSETGYYSYSDSKELIFWKEVKKEIINL